MAKKTVCGWKSRFQYVQDISGPHILLRAYDWSSVSFLFPGEKYAFTGVNGNEVYYRLVSKNKILNGEIGVSIEIQGQLKY